MARRAIGKRTTVQIECPHIIGPLGANQTTEDEELGTDHRCGMEPTTARHGIIDHNAGPLSRFWSAKHDQLVSDLTFKDPTCRG
jgi:hypothetical protein